MSTARILGGTLLGTVLAIGTVDQSTAWPVLVDTGASRHDTIVNVRAVRGGGARAGGSVTRRTNVKVNQHTTVNVSRNVNVVRRPVRVWAPRPYYGAVIGGVALGTIITVAAVGAAPVAPAPNMCWFWADAAQMTGYWDYCRAP